MALIGIDFSEIDPDVREQMKVIFSRDHELAMIRAQARQEQIAKFYHENPPVWSDGIGAMEMSIDPVLLNAWRWRLGEEGDEKAALEWIAKKNGFMKVKAISPKTQVGYRSSPDGAQGGLVEVREIAGREVKFRKTY